MIRIVKHRILELMDKLIARVTQNFEEGRM